MKLNTHPSHHYKKEKKVKKKPSRVQGTSRGFKNMKKHERLRCDKKKRCQVEAPFSIF